MSKQRHRRRSQGGTTPETTPETGSGVAQFSVSEVAQFSMSVDTARATAWPGSPQTGSYPPRTDSSGRLGGGRRGLYQGWNPLALCGHRRCPTPSPATPPDSGTPPPGRHPSPSPGRTPSAPGSVQPWAGGGSAPARVECFDHDRFGERSRGVMAAAAAPLGRGLQDQRACGERIGRVG